MSFLYPHQASFHRPADQTGIGAVGYGGQTQGTETPIAGAQDIRCSIQERREGQNSRVGLPADGTTPTHYVFIPKSALPNGTLKSRDIMIDGLARRYLVLAPYWDSLGYRLTVLTLEA
jgi:hypothetical protein